MPDQGQPSPCDVSTELGADAIVRALINNGITRGFCVPGESYLGLLQSFAARQDVFDLVVCRHEGGASYLAEAQGRLTGRPGLCLVTRGPGACNALIGVATAMQESTPMILVIGHVSTGTAERFPFQGMDPKAVFGSVAKWVGVVERASDIPHFVARAIRVAQSGRPGPVVLAIPDDVQMEQVPVFPDMPMKRPELAPSGSQIDDLGDLLAASRNPLVILGGNGWDETAAKNLQAFVERYDLPVSTSFRRNDLIDNASANYIGSFGPVPHQAMVRYARDSDLILLLGGRLSEIETGRYAYLSEPSAARKLVHAAPLNDEFGEVLEPSLAISTDVAPLAAALAQLTGPNHVPWSSVRQSLRDSYAEYRKPVVFQGRANPGDAVESLNAVLPEDAVICAGAGNYSHFVLRHHRFKRTGTLLAPISGPMGYSVPAAISAALANPEVEAVAYVGDGCFFMNPQELVVAVTRGLRVTVVMFNNGLYGSIRMHQEMNAQHGGVATTLDNPDFQMLARSFGMDSVQIQAPHSIAEAYKTLRAKSRGPVFIELLTDPEVITTQRTIRELREA